MENYEAGRLGKREGGFGDSEGVDCKAMEEHPSASEAGFEWKQSSARSTSQTYVGVFADLKNRLGEFSEKIRMLKQKIKTATRSEWLEHEVEAREKAKLGRDRMKSAISHDSSPQTEKQLLSNRLEQVIQECRDTMLRWDFFSAEFQNSKGWRESLRSILFSKHRNLTLEKNTALIDLYYREVLCVLPLMMESSDTFMSNLYKPITFFILRSDVIEFLNLVQSDHKLSQFWRTFLGLPQSQLNQNEGEPVKSLSDSEMPQSRVEISNFLRIFLMDGAGSYTNQFEIQETLEVSGHILLATNCPPSLMMSLKQNNRLRLPITLIGTETKQNLGSWFGDLQGFEVLRTNLVSENFCNKLVTSTDGDKCEAVATYIASLYYKSELSFKVMIPDASSLLTRLVAKLKERGINESCDQTKSKAETLEANQRRRITYEKLRKQQKQVLDGSLPEKDEVRIYMAGPSNLESLQRIMIHNSAYKHNPSGVILMYNHEEAYRIRNDKTLNLAGPELLLDLLCKIQRSSEEVSHNYLKISRKDYPRNFELAVELASCLLRDFETRGSVQLLGEHVTEYDIKLSRSQTTPEDEGSLLTAIASRRNPDGDNTLYSLVDFKKDLQFCILDLPAIHSTIVDDKGPLAGNAVEETTRIELFNEQMAKLQSSGSLTQLKVSTVSWVFKKLDSISTAELSAAFFAKHEEGFLRIKSFDLMTAALFNNGIVALEHIKKPRQNLLGEQLQVILNNYYTSPDKVYQSLADETQCSLNIPHEVHFMHFQLSQRMISSVLKDLKTYLENEFMTKGAFKSETPKSLQHNIFFHRFSGLIRGCQVMKSLCSLIQEAHQANREMPKHLDRLSKVCPLVLMELVEKHLDKLGLQ